MRRFFTFFAALFAFVGCSQDDVVTPNAPIEKPTYYASFADAEADSRTYLDENFMLLWHNDDRISLFATTYNEEYAFADATGSNSGAFNAVDKDSYVTGNAISTTYAVYPYNAANAISNSEILTIHFPAEQSYAEDSFGRGANTMVAAAQSSSSKLLPFRNAGGYMMLKLYGENKTVKSIELKGNNEEVISGAATAEAKYGYLPLITMGTEGGKSITLTCENAVELGATEAEATTFWIVVPPITFEQGFTITVTNADGGTYTKSTSKPTTINRNEIKSMSALAPTFTGETENPETPAKPANNEIWYTSTDGNIVEPYNTDVFGANIVSNTNENGKGVITFDGEVTKIGKWAFMYRSNLESVILPNTVTYISENAFYDTSLESVLIPENVISIGEYAFSGCDKLQSISLPDGLKSIGKYAFSHCCNLSDIVLPGEMTVIADGMFNGCSSLTNINLPENITTIGTYSFYGTSVTNITIPNKVVSIGNYAFNGCNLVNLTIPASVTSIGYNAFEGSSGELIVNCNIPFGQSNSTRPFYNTNFTKITIGDAVTSIGRLAFYGCNSLTSLTIGKNVTKIGEKAFFGTNITSLDIPDSVTSMGESAFSRCTLLKELTIGSGLTKIPTYAFESCGFTDVIIPDNVNTIGQYAFSDCAELTSVAIPSSVTTIEEGAFENCSSLTSITISDGVTSIGERAFCYCSGLTSITIPESVTEIGERSFWSCSGLTSITIPNSVTKIGYDAFKYCSSLTSVFCECTTPPTVASYLEAFDDNAADRKIYVPRESVDAYKSADGWKNYADSIEPYDF